MQRLLRTLFLSLLFYIGTANAQGNDRQYLDSLLSVSLKSKPDTHAIKALTSLQRYYFEKGILDSSLKYAHISLPKAESIGDQKRIGRIYYNLGLIYSNKNKYDSAWFYIEKAEATAIAIRDTLLQANSYNTQALLSNYQSDFSGAVDYLVKAADLLEKNNSAAARNMLPQVYGNLGHNLIAENQLKKGIDYEKKALQITGYPDENRYVVMIHLDIADGYIKLTDFPNARLHLDSALERVKRIDNIFVKTLVANTEGFYYQKSNNRPKSLAAYLQAYQLSDSSGANYLKAEVSDNIARLYYEMNNTTLAERYATEANTIGLQLSDHRVVASTYELLKDLAIRRSDFKQAVQYAELNKLYADSATNTNTQKLTLSLESRYQSQKKEKELSSLRLENAEKELAVFKRNRLLLIGTIGATALLVTLALLFRNSRQKQVIAEKEQRLQQEQIRFLQEQQQVISLQSMMNGQEAERTRIAKDLHDGLGGLFSTVKMHFSTLEHDIKNLGENELFRKSYSLVDTASVEVRRIAHNMMPEVLMKLGLMDALQDMCNNISAGKLLKISLQAYGMDQRLNSSTEIMLYRIIQELLNNIIKHAQATEAIVQFNRDADRLTVTVEDNGKGFNTQAADEKVHAGLGSIQSRVNYLKGRLSIESQQGMGTTVMMDFLINE